MRDLLRHVAAAALIAAATGPGPFANASTARLEVPFVEQTPALCGGAAAAMMLRYRGAAGVHAGEFAPLVVDSAGGIYADRLVDAIERRGYTVVRPATPGAALNDVTDRRAPLLVLLSSNASTLHFVVVTGVEDNRVIVHDPAIGPDRHLPRDAFMRRWTASGLWSIQVWGEPEEQDHAAAEPMPEAFASSDGETTSNTRIDSVAARARAWRERAHNAFRHERWHAAAAAAEGALAIEPSDEHTWWLLGASRYLAGDATGALDAWNRIDRPRVDLIQAPGERNTRHSIFTGMTGLHSGDLLTASSLRLANRRVRSLPSVTGARVSYRIQNDASAEVRIHASERSNDVTTRGASALLRAATDREVALPVTSAFGAGEVITASGRFWENRPRVQVTAAVPAMKRWPLVVSLAGGWSRQSYAVTNGVVTETHRAAGASATHWFTSHVAVEPSAGYHRIDDGAYGAFGVAGEYRLFDDAVAARVSTRHWMGGGDRHVANALQLAARRHHAGAAMQVDVRGGVERVDADAPLAMRGGVGTGHAGDGLLRAHPLIGADGVMDGAGFAPTVLHASVDATRWLFAPLPLTRLGVAAFADAARMQQPGDTRVLVDAGLGLRFELPASLGGLALDAAHGLRDDAFALSLRWTTSWPVWRFDS
jgi:predicted double-glycine peptidase